MLLDGGRGCQEKRKKPGLGYPMYVEIWSRSTWHLSECCCTVCKAQKVRSAKRPLVPYMPLPVWGAEVEKRGAKNIL